MTHHSDDVEPRQAHDLADFLDLLGEEPAPPHPRINVEVDVDRAAAPYSGRRQESSRLEVSYLLLNVEPSERLFHFGFESHSESEQRNLEAEPTNRLRFGIGANANHVRAGLHGHGRESLEPMTVSIGLHDDAELRGSDPRPQILNVSEKVLARHENLNVVLSHVTYPRHGYHGLCFRILHGRAISGAGGAPRRRGTKPVRESARSTNRVASKAVLGVIVHDPHSLHPGVDADGADELEAARLELRRDPLRKGALR
jgi:hypothetical protein